MGIDQISKHKGLADRSMCCSPGTLLLQNANFALDLSLQFYHMTGQLKAQKSDIVLFYDKWAMLLFHLWPLEGTF